MRRSLEASYHANLTDVRVHTGSAAHEVARESGSKALTSGSDIFFARDQYAPHTAAGWRRVAHEVAHVVQQRRGQASGSAAHASAETEARQGAVRAYDGRDAAITERGGGLLQRDDGEPTSSPEYRLRLDPEIEQMMFQNYLRWWIGTSLTLGEPILEPGTEGAASPALVPPMGPNLFPWMYEPLPPAFLEPIDLTVTEPDVGAIMAPYNVRSVPMASRDVETAMAIFQRNYLFVSALPDIRAMAPDFIRPLIPGHWRRSIAEAFTAATLNAQLRSDYATPIEAADLSFYRLTGISTSYIPIPGFSF